MGAALKTLGLPRIIQFLETIEGGSCPHCGATGRWIARFVCDDGTTRGAMSGCVKLFPVSPVARAHMKLAKKQADYATRGWSLNRWDTESMDAIESCYAGVISETAAMRVVDSNALAAAMWRSAKYGSRR